MMLIALQQDPNNNKTTIWNLPFNSAVLPHGSKGHG